VAEVEALSWSEMKFIFAISYAQAIQAFVDQGEDALRSELERWEPDARAAVAQALAEVALGRDVTNAEVQFIYDLATTGSSSSEPTHGKGKRIRGPAG
jgi:hypothetical protein